jgi:metal-responsive CopG/Arc/MetJ family transcriptional regulator
MEKNKRETGRTLMVSVRINKLWLARISMMAENEGRSRSDLIDRAVEEYVKNHETQPKPPKPPK